MATDTYPKSYGNATYPVLTSNDSHLIKRIEPILTPAKLVSRYLKGIDLSDYSTAELKDYINLAVNDAELELDVPMVPEEKKEKHPFDRDLYRAFVHLTTNSHPIIQVNDLSIIGSNDSNIFQIPASWLEMDRGFQGILHVIPLTVLGATSAAGAAQGGPEGLAFLAALQGNVNWIPSYFQITYLTGVSSKAGQVPTVVNEIIGCLAAIRILGQLGSLNTNTSVSVSHDGISQASSSPGPAVYQTRIGELTGKKDELVKKLKKIYHNKFFLSNI